MSNFGHLVTVAQPGCYSFNIFTLHLFFSFFLISAYGFEEILFKLKCIVFVFFIFVFEFAFLEMFQDKKIVYNYAQYE